MAPDLASSGRGSYERGQTKNPGAIRGLRVEVSPADTLPPNSPNDDALMISDSYNYERFDRYVEDGREAREFAAFPNHLHAGDAAPEISGLLLDDNTDLALSDIWRRRTVVVEFGSFT